MNGATHNCILILNIWIEGHNFISIISIQPIESSDPDVTSTTLTKRVDLTLAQTIDSR